jgi:hypothetical protein
VPVGAAGADEAELVGERRPACALARIAVQYDGAGNYKFTVNNGKVPKTFGGKANPGNVFDDFAKALPGIANSEKLAVVTIVDSSDKVVATMERQGESWIWTDKPKGTP